MARLLDGRRISERRLDQLKREIQQSGCEPVLATVIVGDDPASKMYVRMKHEACKKVGIGSLSLELPAESSTSTIVEEVSRLNKDIRISGILVQLPLPPHVDKHDVISALSPSKDVDGFHPYNLGLLFSGRPNFCPCTPLGIMTLLSEYQIDLGGTNAVVIGRSIDVGRPLAALLTEADATVTLCHSKTLSLREETERADLLVSAVGRAHLITSDMIKPGATVIDVGINRLNGKLVGDVDFESVQEIAGAVTPVPGGVGPMTISTLMENTYSAAMGERCRPVH